MPAGGRNVNAPVCTARDRSNYLVKSRESSFPTPLQTPEHVDHSRRTWYFFNPAAIELLHRSSSSLPFLFLSLYLPRMPRVMHLFYKHSESTCAQGDAINRLIVGASEGSSLFAGRDREELLSRKSFAKFRNGRANNSSGSPSSFDNRRIACLENFPTLSDPLNKEQREENNS